MTNPCLEFSYSHHITTTFPTDMDVRGRLAGINHRLTTLERQVSVVHCGPSIELLTPLKSHTSYGNLFSPGRIH